ncbi:hypothetical protein SPRG_09670 [Saprolegnia parasitica CBS 223.65]|uniref:Vacuolar membrane protease n=1 Tax=Saprolegnia parasitica (strain CBS 223.65) TaxID=695850 RepID=A0A067CDE1_SAPPC|nr:hypothetical protein SPRG_09670 [Saprolegnia parasitica CBS 223.65]KDO24837.1 hypothetical protein SPRG_09670 [Saprolegnia parasitica CBS 223.65]|eukprot:XP_012204484.1 hypothetical protein SPRG_09670 [Saprolegnia parasitica CBS 223.65]
MSRFVPCTAILLSAALALLFNVIWRAQLPAPLDVPPADGRFAGAAAYKSLATIARAKHPIATDAKNDVYSYLYDSLEALRAAHPRLVLDTPRATRLADDLPSTHTPAVPRDDDACANASWYFNKTQIIARVPGTSNDSILLTAHFESVAPSDAGVAVLLQVLSTLLARNATSTHSLVVFFNNQGEENGLCGSRWFVEQHLLSTYNAKAFLNVQGGNAGGRAILLRTTDDALAFLYASVAPHPHMNSLGGVLLQVLGSRSDYEVYQPAGIPGLDVAFYEQYADARDDAVDFMSPSELQFCGDNILAVTSALLALPTLQFDATGSAVYFDVLGSFGISLTPWVRVALTLVAMSLAALVLGVSYHSFPLYDTMIVVTPKAFALSVLGEWTYIVRSFAQALVGGLFFNLPVAVLLHTTQHAHFASLALPAGFLGNVLGATAAAHKWRHGQPHPNVNAYIHFAASVASCSAGFALLALLPSPIWILFAIASIVYSSVLLVFMAAIMYVRYQHETYGPDDEATYIPTRTAMMYYSSIRFENVLSPRAPQLRVYLGLAAAVAVYMFLAFELSVDIALDVASVGAKHALVLWMVPLLLTPTLYVLVSLCAYWEPNAPSYRFYYLVYVLLWIVMSMWWLVTG